jgi:hypothetical protein
LEALGSRTQQTKDYDAFVILNANREVSRPHVNKLMRVFRDNPRASEYRPILVNEKMEVIDGQHRLTALTELNFPVFYTVVPGLTIVDTQQMNAYQKNWDPIDYAKSYATLGHPEYQRFLYFYGKYNFTFRTTLVYMVGGAPNGIEANFRTGGFNSEATDDQLDERFTMLEDVVDEIHSQVKNFNRKDPTFARAYLVMVMRKDYDHEFFMHKLSTFCAKFITRGAQVAEYQRQLESIWNHNTKLDEKRIRLF